MIAHRYYLQHTCYQMSYIQNNFKQVDKKRWQKRWWIRGNQSQGQSEETPGADGTQEYLQSHLESQPKLKADSDDKYNRGPADQPRLATRLCMLWLLRYFFMAVCSISPICLRPYVELFQKLFTTVRCICDFFLPVFFSDISTRVEFIPCIIPFFFSRLECTLLHKCTLITKTRILTSLILISEFRIPYLNFRIRLPNYLIW